MVYKFITRSKGVVIFAVILMAFGAFSAFLVLLSLLMASGKEYAKSLQAVMAQGGMSMPLFWTSSLAHLLIYLSWVVCGAGALHLKEWARQFLRIVMSVYAINMLINITLNINLAHEMVATVPVFYLVIGIMLSFSFYLSVIYFFSHPDIVRQFKFKSREY